MIKRLQVEEDTVTEQAVCVQETWVYQGINGSVVLVAQSCLILSDPMDFCLPGSSVHGILQGRILEWVAIPFSRASSQCAWPRSIKELMGEEAGNAGWRETVTRGRL